MSPAGRDAGSRAGGARFTRREALGLALAGAGAASLAAAAGCSGEAGPPRFDGRLRVLGSPEELLDPLARLGERDLGFPLAFRTASPDELVVRATERPASFDVVAVSCDRLAELRASGAVVALERARLLGWRYVTELYKTGKRTRGAPACTVGAGDAPFRLLYAERAGEAAASGEWGRPDGSGPPPGVAEPEAVAGAPSTYALDAFGYDGFALAREPDDVSWAELLNGSLGGRVALAAEAEVGLVDAALAASAAGVVEFADLARPTRAEVDGLVRMLEGLRDRGHFRTFWSTFDGSVELMREDGVVAQSMSFPAVSLLQASGAPARYAAPPEGYRGAAGLLCVSAAAARDPGRLAACHELIDWWHAGVPGALLMRLGIYSAAQVATFPHVHPDEWAYWIDGEPAPAELDSFFLERSIRRGSRRDGGSLRRRACRIALWRTALPEHARARWAGLAA